MMADKMVLLGASDSGQRLYYVIGFAQRPNGIVESYGQFSDVDLMAYLTRPNSIKPIKKSKFQKRFWEFDYENEDWQKTFLLPASKPNVELLRDSKKYISPVPEAEQQEPSSDNFLFKSMGSLFARRLPWRSESTDRLDADLQIKAPLNFRRRLIEEPYDPDARDGDGDGIVQEGTPWERPAGTRVMDASGREIARGQISTFRSRSHRIVDADGNAVDYVPTYERSDVGTIGRSVGVVRGPERDAEDSVDVDVNENRPSRVPDYLRTAAKGLRTSSDTLIYGIYASRLMSAISEAGNSFLNIGRLKTGGSLNAEDLAEQDEIANRISTALGIPARFTGLAQLRDAAEIAFPISPEPAVAERWQEVRKRLLEEAEEFIQELNERGTYVAVPSHAFFGEDLNQEDVEQGVIFEPGILRDEQIKSQFETWTSQGLYNEEYRSAFELGYMNIPEDIADSERPIYGFIPSRTKDDGLEPDASGDRARVYAGDGGVFIRLRPEVSERSTISFGDSLDHRHYPIPLDKELRDEHVRQLDEEGAELSGVEILILGALGPAGQDVLAARLVDRFIEENLSGSDSLSDLWTPGQLEEELPRGLDYIESQIHGGVDLSDVEEVILPNRLQFNGDNEGRPLALDFLASANPHAKRLLAAARKYGFTVSWEDEVGEKTVYYSATPQAPKVQASTPSSTFTGSKPDPIPSASIEDMDLSPGTNADSMDRDELIAPVKPRAPYTPAPPPFSGRAAEIVDRAEGDFERVLELLDDEGYWLLYFETTGFDHGNMPTQVAMVRVEDGKVVRRINQFINPDRPLSDWSRQHLRDGDGNPLTEEWLAENGISVEDAQGRLSAILKGQIVVAHNAPFDLEVLQRIVDENDGTLELGGSVDTLALMRMAVPKGDGEETGPTSHGLGSLASYLGYELGDGAHDAMADVDATNEVLRRGLLSAVDNERAEVGVLDNEYMADLYEKQKQEHAVSMAKHRDAMREYNKQVFEYRRALSESKDTEIPDVRVPYTPGPATGEAVIDSAATSRAATKSLMTEKLIDLLADVGKGEEGDIEWDRLASAIRDALGREEADVIDRRLRREWLAANLTPLLERDNDFINELVDNALNEYADRELAKQIYVPATESTAATIIDDGRIQTHFETQPEGFAQSLRERASVETELLGVPRDTADRGRPIYGFIPRTPDAGFAGNSQLDSDPTRDAATMHGPVLFRLKDEVRARTTATFGDSMTGSVGTAVPLTEAAREALLASFPDPTKGSRGDVRTGLLHAAVSGEFHEAAASIAARAWIDRLPDELRRGVLRRIRSEEAQAMIRPQNPRYIETQIHGGVALEDVAEIVLPNSTESLGEDIREVLRLARERSSPVVTADGRVPLETDVGWKFIAPDVAGQTDTKAFVGHHIEVKAASRRAALIDEPYDPDARDGDGDGIVQEWTVWERPAGTKLYIDGKPVTRGLRIQSTSITARPNNLVIRDAAGNEVDYVPTYMPKPEEGTIGADLGRLTPEPAEQGEVPKPVGTGVDAAKPKKRGSPLADVGTPSLQELGASSVRQTARPPAATVSPAPEGQEPQAVSGTDSRLDPPIAARKNIRSMYTPGLSEFYSSRKKEMQDRMRKYMESQVEAVRETFLDKMTDHFLDQLSDEMSLDSPEATDEIVNMFGPIIVSPEAFREELGRITGSGLLSLAMHDAVWELLQKMFSEHFDADLTDAIVEAYRDEVELLTSGPVRIAIGNDALLLALNSGRVKSQFETGYSRGSFAPEYRASLENTIMGVPENFPEYENIPDTLRPIYGFFADQRREFGWNEDGEFVVTPMDWTSPNGSALAYGNHQIILRVEARDRTTATVGDSFGSRGAVVPLDDAALMEIGDNLDYFTEDGEVDLERVKNTVYMLSYNGQDSHTTISSLAVEGLMRRQSPRKEAMLRKLLVDTGAFGVGSLKDANWMGFLYTEAQIHGGVDIEDIEKVILPYADISEVPLALVKLLEDRNIPFSLSPRGFDQ